MRAASNGHAEVVAKFLAAGTPTVTELLAASRLLRANEALVMAAQNGHAE
jgi:hypothetical protein